MHGQKDFELAIQWLEDAGLILKSYRVSKPDIPLIAYMEMNSFKMFMFDVGLLTAKAGLSARLLLREAGSLKNSRGHLRNSMLHRSYTLQDIRFIILQQHDQLER